MNQTQIGVWVAATGTAIRSVAERGQGVPALVAEGVGAGLELIGDLLTLGRNPVDHIEVVRDMDADLRAIREERARLAEERLRRG